MKTINTILTLLVFSLSTLFADAQGNCPGDNIKVYKGATGCQCQCLKQCVTPAELPIYLANGWNTNGCWNCCKAKNWVDAGIPKTSLDEVHPGVEPGSLTVSFTLASEGDVKIRVADMTGRHMATIADEHREDVNNELIWDQSVLSPGIYFLTLEAGDHHETKMISVME